MEIGKSKLPSVDNLQETTNRSGYPLNGTTNYRETMPCPKLSAYPIFRVLPLYARAYQNTQFIKIVNKIPSEISSRRIFSKL